MQLHIFNCTFIFCLLVQNVISWSAYFTLCWPSIILRNEETRIYSALVVNISRAERWSDSTILKQMSADLPCTMYSLTNSSLCDERSKFLYTTGWLMIYVIVSWIEPALSWPLVFVVFGDMFSPKTRKSAFLEKSLKNKKCLKVFEKILKYNCSIGIRYHSRPRLFVSNVKVPQKRVNRLVLKNVSFIFLNS